MKKLILFVAGLMAIATTVVAQGIVNSGARMVSQSGTYWVVDGNVTIKSESATNLAAAANIKINTGATLTLTGSSVLTVSGTWQNDGTCTATTGSTVTLNGAAAQQIGGTNETTFSNLTLNNSTGITLSKSITANGILDFQNGMVNTGVNSAIIGASGSITNAGATKYINGKLAFTFSALGSKVYPIGKGGIYRPITFQYSGLTGTSIVTAEQIESAIPGTIPANGTAYTSRYWAISQTGGSSLGYQVSLDGTGFTPSGTKSIILGDGTTNATYAATFASPTYTNTAAFSTMGNVTVGYSCTPQTVVFGALTAKNSCDAPFTVSATGGASSSPVVFTSSDSGVATCSGTNGTTITIIKAGTCTITATQAGDATYCQAVQARNLVVNNVPATAISSQATLAQSKCVGGTFLPLTVTATGSSLTYQWYSNTTASVTGGTSLAAANGAQTNSYTPQTASAGTIYFYCVVTGTCGSVTSTISGAIIATAASAISSQSTATQTKTLNGTFTAITVTAAGGGLTYQWYKNTTAATTGGTSLVTANGAQTSSYTPQATATGTLYYYCTVSGSCGSATSTVSGAFVTSAATAITSQSTAARFACLNGSFTGITVSATGTNLTYQWYSNTTASNTGGTSLVAANGAQTNSYTPQTTVAGTLYYYCIVSGTGGSVTSVISGAMITNATTAISSQSTATQTKCLNSAFSAITVTASGTGTLTYQWYSNASASTTGGTSLGTSSGANTASYTPQSNVAGTLYYYCIVTGTCSTATSTISGAMITSPSTAISSQSTNTQTKCMNGTFTAITVTASGTSLTYQWYSNTSASITGGTSLGTNNGSNTNSYTPQSTLAGTLYYYCTVTGTCASVTSSVSGAIITNSAIAISSQSTATQTACINGSFTAITITATGTGLSYQWYKNTSASNTGGTSLGTGNGANTSTYTPQATIAGTLYYYCMAGGTCGGTTSAVSGAMITNPAAAISGQSTAAQSANLSGTFTAITVTATGAGLTYQWYKNTSSATTGGTSLTAANGAQTNSYTPQASTGGTLYYYCVVTGTCGSATSSISGAFVVNSVPAASGTISGTATVCQNQTTVSYNVSAISGATSYTWAYSGNGASITGTTNSVTITFAGTATSGNLNVKGTNSYGDGTVSANYAITVNPATAVSSQSTATQTQCIGGTFTAISVTGAGGGLSYQWYSNASANNSGGTSLGSANGAQTSSYTPQVGAAGTLYYYCVITGSCATATSAVSGAFIVNAATAIGSQSTATQTQCQNGTFTPITVTATGAGTLTYQWYKNTSNSNSGGTSLSGSISNSYTPSTTTVGTLYYYCIVHSDCGSNVTSAVSGALIVSDPPAAPTSLTATPTSVCNGSSSLLNATSAGNTIDWYTASSGGNYLGTSASGADYTIYPGSTATYYAEAVGVGSSSGTQTFSYTGTSQTFTVPEGITSITVNARGAAGSATGGSVVTKLIVTPGSTLNIYVGGAGTLGSLAVGGWNGGGTAGSAHGDEGSGGGASDIRIGGTALSNRVVVAGGGGGIGGYLGGSGGAGGGSTTGANGIAGQGGGGGGGTQSAGGSGGTPNGCGTGGAGSLGVGGAGGLCSFGGGGGGGGYYGGGGGGGDNNSCCADGGGGGGGSSYTDPTLTTGTTHTQGGNTGNGQVILSWTGGSTCPSPRTPVTVTISTPPTGGSISGASTVVYGSSTGTMTLSGHTNGSTVVKWQKSLDKGTWADITNTTTTCSEIPTAPGTWQYRAQVTSSTCTAFSNPISIVVTKKELTIGGTFTANNRAFNGNTTATIATNSLTLLTKVGSDDVTITSTVAAVFDNKGVGTGKTVSLTGSTLGGANADNYTLSLTGAPTATANITAIAPTLGALSINSKIYGDPAFELVNPTSNSSGTFSYGSSNTAVATISGNTVTIVGAGTSTITATQAVSDPLEGYASATTSATLTVAKADQVVTLGIPTSAPLNTFTGSPVAITATSSAGLTVTIAKSGDATATLGGTPGSYTLSGVSSTGTLTFTATPSGDGNYNAVTAISKSFDVTRNNQTIAFSGSFPVTYTYSPTLTIDLSAAATATITPMTYAVVSGPATVAGTTLSITGAGTVVLRASQAGDTNHNPAPDVNQNITISKATPVITFANYNKVYSDAPFTLSATSVSTGTFSYSSSVVGVATTAIVSAVSTATLTGVGATTLTATQAADANYNSATKDATLTVSKADQTITFGTPANKIEGDASFVLAASSNSGLAVNFASGTASVASLSGTNNATAAVGSAGTSTITASQAGDSHYNAATNVDRTLTVLACSNPTNGGTIATAQENCTNFDPATMTSSGLPTGHPSGSTLEYQWQKSTTSNSAGFADITDATATSYDPSTISQTTWYRRLARASCRADWSGATASNVVAMTVSPTIGGTVTGSSTIAYNSPVTMTLSGHTGSVLKWQSSPDGTTWTDIANTTTTCTVTPATVGSWQYRAQVQSYSCLVKFSAALSITVTANPLTITGISIVTKNYNGNTTATLTGTAVLVGVKSGETVTIGGTPVATFASRNVATGIAVSITGYTIGGANAGNYTLTQPASLTGNINAVQLTPSIAANNKAYNGLTTATLSAQSVTGIITGETVTLIAGAINFDTKDIGTGKTVTASSLTLGGADAANYSLASGATATITANITAIQLTPSITANNKPYDGNTTAVLNTQSVSGMVNSETDVTLVVGAANFDNAEKGTGKTVTATTLSLGGTKAGNYVLASGATATVLANITSVELTPHITASDKTYDGNTSAALSAKSVSGMVNSETDVTLVVGASDFDTKAIGTGKTVTATSLTLGGTKAGNYTLASGATATNTAAITAITLTPSIIANDRPYNGTTTATLSTQAVSGMIAGETDVTLVVGAANFSTGTIGTNKTVTASALSLDGTDKGNYVLASGATATDVADITVVQVTPQITANNKPYDGNATATLSAQSVSGAVSGETVTLIVGAASFENADKGVGKTVTANTLSLSGANAANYELASATATALANIASVSLTPHITALDKAYDGNTTATLSAQSVTGMTPGKTDVILLVNAASFDTKNAGLNKTVTASGLTLGGSDASNYVLAASSVTGSATVTAIEVTPHITAADKSYDGQSTATLSEKHLTGQLVGEDVTLVATATFDTRNIGAGKTVTTGALTLGGADRANYVLTSAVPLTAQAAITVLQVTPHITASDKPYDGNTVVTLSEQSLVGPVSGESVALTIGAVSFDTKNAGTDKTVTASNLSLAGTDAANYLLTPGITATDLADITALQLTPHITADDKAYDGNTTAAISAQSVTGQLSGEPVTLIVGASNFDTKNIGTGKTVSATSLSLGGAYVANYVLASSTSTDLADITAIQVTPVVVAGNKPYDGNTTATLSSQTLTGQVSGDDVTLIVGSSTFDTKQIGTNKEVTASAMTLGGIAAGNYLLTTTSLTDQADITATTITPHITANDKQYDGSTIATLSAQSVTGQLSGETVTLEVGASNFNTKNIGTDKTVTATSLSLGGADAGNYVLAPRAAATDLADVSAVEVTPQITADDKTYDGNSTATYSSKSLTGKISGDDLSLVIGAVSFDTKNIGTNKTVTASALSLTGTDASNYNLTSGATATDIADIKTIKLYVSGAVAENKIYDGNTTAQITGATLVGKSGSDDVVLAANPTGTFAQTGIKSNIVVTPVLEITGADFANYTLVQPTGLKASITARPLTIGGSFVVNDKSYNGTTAAAIATNNLILLTKVGSEAVTLNPLATFDTKTAGTGKMVSLTGSTLAGANAGNYTLSLVDAPTTTATITAISPNLSAFSAINKTYEDPDFALVNPISDSPGAFSFASSDETVAIITGKTVTILKAGTSTITATQAADGGYSSATSSAMLTVAKANQLLTLTLPTAAPLNTFTGTSLAITATSSSALPVTITRSGTATATLNGTPDSYTLTGVSASGTVVIDATQAGNDNYNPASISKSFDVQKNNQTVTFSGSFMLDYTFASSLSIDLSAAANATSALAVGYSVLSGPATISGNTLNASGAGIIVVQASQSGDANTNPAPQVNQNIVIGKATPVITFANITKTYGDAPFTLSATSAGTGGFRFDSSDPNVATTEIISAVTTGTITGAGTTSIIVTRDADANYVEATASANLTVSKADQAITINPLSTPVSVMDFDNAPIQVVAASTSGLPVTLTLSAGSVASLSGSNQLFTTLQMGTVTVNANQAGDTNYNAASQVTQTITVSKANQTITFNALAVRSAGSVPFGLVASSSSALPISFTSSNSSVATISGTTVTVVGAGTTTITASQAGNDYYNAATDATRILTVSTLTGDVNGDGKITPPEIAGDKDGDGKITFPEIAGDTDGDGTITDPEIAGDTNGDGTITDPEIAGDKDGDGKITFPEIAGDKDGDGTITFPEIVGDNDGDGKITSPEIAGDKDGDGKITFPEIAGDKDGDGKITFPEIVGDNDGDGKITSPEIAGDKDGDGKITFPEIAGDKDGDGTITFPEIAGDNDGDGKITSPEIAGDKDGDGKITFPEIAGDKDGDGKITFPEIAGDNDGDGKITSPEIAGDNDGDGKITFPEIAGDKDGDGKITFPEIAGDNDGDGKITSPEIAGDNNGDGKITFPEIAGDKDGDGKITFPEIAGDKDGDGKIIFPEIAGDNNGDGKITFPEIAGDKDGDGKITSPEIAGDKDGDGKITFPEIAGDNNGDGKITFPEIAGDKDGDGKITFPEIAGDKDGDGKITFPEIAGDNDGDGKITSPEIAGDNDGDGKITSPEIAGDKDGDGKITFPEIAGDNDGDGKIIFPEIAGDNNGDGKITFPEIAGDKDGDGKITFPEIAGDNEGDGKITSPEIAGDNDGDGKITSPEIAGDKDGDGKITFPEIAGDKDGDGKIIFPEIAGDNNGDGKITFPEIAGDKDGDGKITFPEIAGDKDGDGKITSPEIAGDKDGDGKITFPEITGDKDGDGKITFPEIAGDKDGDGKITFPEIAGDNDGDGKITSPEIAGDNDGDGKITSPEIAGDKDGDGKITFPEIAGDNDGDGKIIFPEIAGDNNGDGKITSPEIAGDKDGDGKITFPEIAGDKDGDGKITFPEIAGDKDGDGKITFPEIVGDNDGDGKITSPEIAGDKDGDGKITSPEIAGDKDGDGKITFPEIAGDKDGDGKITSPEIAGDKDGDGKITFPEIAGDKDGDGKITFPEIVGDNDGDGKITFPEIVGDNDGDGKITAPEIAGDKDGDGKITFPEIAGDKDGDGKITFPEITGDNDGDGKITSPEIAGDKDGDGKITFPEIAGDKDGDSKITTPEIAGDTNGDGTINGTELTGDKDGDGKITYPEVLGDTNGDGTKDVGTIVGDINGDGKITAPEIAGDTNGDGKITAPEIAGDTNGDGVITVPEITGDTNGDGIINIPEIAGDTNGDGKITGSEVAGDPMVQLNTIGNQIICNGSGTALITFATGITGGTTTYAWSNDAAGIGLAASGTGNIAAFATVNTGTSSVVATIKVVPTYTIGSVVRIGLAKTFTITVHPSPAATAGSDRTICLNSGTTLGAATVTGNTYSWTSFPAGFTSSLANPVVNPTLTTSYTLIESVTATGCTNSHSVNVNVKQFSVPVITGQRMVCAGTTGVAYTTDALMTGYQWTLPPGAKIVSGAGTNAVVVDFSAAASIGFVAVTGLSDCGTVLISNNYPVMVTTVPVAPRIIGQGHTLISSADAGNQWYLDGKPITTNGTAKQYMALEGGAYTVKISRNNCWSESSYSYALSPMSQSEIEVDVFPNPSHGHFNLKIATGKPEIVTIDIMNKNGKLLWRKEKILVDNNYLEPIDFYNIPPAMYVIKVYNSNVNKSFKLIITK